MENNTQSSEPVLHSEPQAAAAASRAKLESFSTLFKSSWQFYKSNFKQVFSFFFLLGFLPALVQLVVQYAGFQLSQLADSWIVTIIMIVITGLIALAINIALQVLYLGSIKKLNDIHEGVSDTIWATFKKILKFTLPIIVTGSISFALIIGGGIALLVPGILFAISSSFIGAVIVVENKKGIDALVQSFWYAHERRGQILGRSILMILSIVGMALAMFIVLASIAIALSIGIFGGIDEAVAATTMFLMANTSPMGMPTGSFVGFLVLWSAFASVISALLWGLFSIFSFKMWQNAKSITPSEIPSDYNDKTRKQIRKWAWIGLAGIIVMIIIQLFSIYYQCQRVHCPLF